VFVVLLTYWNSERTLDLILDDAAFNSAAMIHARHLTSPGWCVSYFFLQLSFFCIICSIDSQTHGFTDLAVTCMRYQHKCHGKRFMKCSCYYFANWY